MNWIWVIVAIQIVSGVIAIVRFLTLAQNNNYVLPHGRSFFIFYIPLVFFLLGTYVFLLTGKIFDNSVFYLFGAFFSAIELLFVAKKSFFSRIKYKFSTRGKYCFIFIALFYIFAISILSISIKKVIILGTTIYCINLIIPLFLHIILSVINMYYNAKNNKYIIHQKNALLQKKPIVVGITGSYGKTSCKKILETLLSDDYSVVVTDKNYNTPMGVALSIDKINEGTEIFIAEFGARKEGDIQELCKLFPPKYGIISGICAQHLETFGTLENICMEKQQLAKAVEKAGGVCVFNTNDKYVMKMYKDHKGRKISAGCNKKCNAYAKDIVLKTTGSSFTLHIGKESTLCETKLLGKHQVSNIVLCAALAYELGCSMERIKEKIAKIPQIKHRLEYIYSNGVHILDDAYNGNIRGIKSALEVVDLFDCRKIIVAQGVVELGKIAKEENEKLGREFAKCFDIVILTGVNKKYILNGLKQANFAGEIIIENSFKCVKKVIQKRVKPGDLLYLQNDIPDIY